MISDRESMKCAAPAPIPASLGTGHACVVSDREVHLVALTKHRLIRLIATSTIRDVDVDAVAEIAADIDETASELETTQ